MHYSRKAERNSMKALCGDVEKLEQGGIRRMFNMAQDMEDAIILAIGEPGFTAADHIAEAAIHAIRNGNTHYTVNAGVPELRKKLSEKTEVGKGVKYDWDSEIMVTAGGIESIYLSMKVILSPGDEVILGAPYFPNYIGVIKMCGAVPVLVKQKEENAFRYNVKDLESAITNKTKLLLINSPCNPTGAVTGEDTLREIAALVKQYDLYLMTDEVYQDFIYDADTKFFSIVTCSGMKERTVIVDSFSKTYAMTGWRCGFTLAPAGIIKQMVKIQENVVSCVNTPTQYGAIAALEGPQTTIKEMRREYGANRDYLVKEVETMPGLRLIQPKGAFYAFVSIQDTGMTSEEFAIRLLKEKQVVVVPGTAFGEAGEGYVRISYVTSKEQLAEGCRRMKEFAVESAQK
jgi:aminotransferase